LLRKNAVLSPSEAAIYLWSIKFYRSTLTSIAEND
jgi:hypothetical protein